MANTAWAEALPMHAGGLAPSFPRSHLSLSLSFPLPLFQSTSHISPVYSSASFFSSFSTSILLSFVPHFLPSSSSLFLYFLFPFIFLSSFLTFSQFIPCLFFHIFFLLSSCQQYWVLLCPSTVPRNSPSLYNISVSISFLFPLSIVTRTFALSLSN